MWKKYKTLSITTKASLWAFVASIIQKGITILATPIFTRILTTEEYAQYALYQSWYDLFIIVSSLCVYNYATYTAMIKFEKERNDFITSAQMMVTLLSFVVFIVYIIIYNIYGDFTGFPLYIILLMFIDIICMSSFYLWKAKERCLFKYKVMTILSLAIGVLGPIFGILAVKMSHYSGVGRIYGIILIDIMIGIGIYFYNIHLSKCFFKKIYWKYIFSYCLPLIPHFIALQILSRIDRIMINDMCGASQVGIYTLAYSLSMLMLFVNDAIFTSLTPWTYQKIKENKKEDIKVVANLVILLVGIANIILILFAPEAVRIFAPKEYYEAIYIIPAVSTSVFFMFLFNLFANIEYYYSKTKMVAIASILAAIIKIVLNYIFINRFGYMAAGYTTMISYMFFAIGHYVLMKRVSKEFANGYNFYDNKTIFIISFIFVLISLLIIPLYNLNLIRYIFIVIILFAMVINRNLFIKYRALLHK